MRSILILILIAVLTIQISGQTNSARLSELKVQVTDRQSGDFGIQTLPERKKAGTAVLYSLLLPGMGELYAGKNNFFISVN